ncbi:putative Epidermal growth factor receptor [Daphnia magna]|uniref:Epidermal growth factor receptor n=1 Tax=Daphnia magna TaxID=35525 RepID=A0A164TND3_9CRUS|nr:putative Epidermal growth factor receptor [Daphnia magna]
MDKRRNVMSRALSFAIAAAFALLAVNIVDAASVIEERVCIGTNGRMSVPSNREHHYRNLRDRYTNCTYVDGNLELTWLQDEHLDLTFLQHIREVTGYVLISHVDVKRIVLPALQIIRGRTLFKLSVHDEEFALVVTLSKMHNLEMPALRDILAGSCGLFNNYNLCHMKTINWEEIITGTGSKIINVYNFTEPERECPACHESCEAGCWGEGPENCQKFSKINCSPQCHQGRCFGPRPRECCHLFCAGGCTGPKQSDCLACRNFFDDGVCNQECPAMQRYNPITYSWETNPEGKYAYGATCVKTCPEHLLKDNGACVRICPAKKKAVNGECVVCDGPCPKTCQGVDIVHAGNIESFRDCTVIEGSISILDHSFGGFQQIYPNFTFGPRYPRLHPDRLEIFSTLQEITGFINVQASHPDFKNLSYFRNLETIGGRQLTEYFSALYIVKTSLNSLHLRSLKMIRAGSVTILENKELCFAESISWTKIIKSQLHGTLLQNNKVSQQCQESGLVCSAQCSVEGCWGLGPNECLSCAHFQLDETCVESCDLNLGIYELTPKLCKHCHHECDETCTGPGPGNCTVCKHVKDGPYCVPACPTSKFNDSGECVSCHDNCVGGCTGPENNIGPRGCHSCEKAVINGDVEVDHCLKKNETCPDGYYYEWVGPQEQGPLKPLAGKAVCRKCHPRCKRCIGYGFHEQVCQECVKYKRGEQCEDECPQDHYADEERHECSRCASECRGCSGPNVNQCQSCRNYRVYLWPGVMEPLTNLTQFNCTANCPAEAPHKIFPADGGDPYCAKEPVVNPLVNGDEEHIAAILGGVIGCVTLLGVFLACFGYHWHQRAKSKENTAKMTMVMSGYEDSEPLRPSHVKPNLAKLRIVKEAELRRGGILGYGAFGTVYKGVWVPEGENVKIPVAIKVLREGTGSNTNREILDEAYIMASVEHPNLLQLLAVCMTSQMMLVTQLMPLGCLLDYVRNNRDKIGSKPLLNWCTQIARGMAYLEERRLVHRDLAARNVLVQNPACVKITDFGLAKLLDINEDEYKAAGGKMPIKWLALECIQHRIFTHKSDVWAFGVTVWELLTYGGRPYENVPAREVPDLLEKGERLPQPPTCTIDVYMIMIKCWMLDAESRPSFKELADEFAKMARDPGRYLVIPGDKLMRLPSYSPQDEKELIRNLSSSMDGPEVIMDAEEYLQPKSRCPLPSGSNVTSDTPLPPPTPVKKYAASSTGGGGGSSIANGSEHAGVYGAEGFSSQGSHRTASPSSSTRMGAVGQHHHPHHLTGLPVGHHPGGFHPSQQLQQQHSRDSGGPSLRYCSDPLQLIGKELEAAMEDRRLPHYLPGVKTGARVGNLKLDLPVDEDDYLMPSPQSTQPHHAGYMDLIGDAKLGDNGDLSSGDYHARSMPDFVKSLPAIKRMSGMHPTLPLSMDNPEYHMMNNQDVNTLYNPSSPSYQLSPTSSVSSGLPVGNGATLGIPVNSLGVGTTASSSSSSSGSATVQFPTGAFGPRYLTQRSSEEEGSDHDYYNDLQRELQPLQPLKRNETTV